MVTVVWYYRFILIISPFKSSRTTKNTNNLQILYNFFESISITLLYLSFYFSTFHRPPTVMRSVPGSASNLCLLQNQFKSWFRFFLRRRIIKAKIKFQYRLRVIVPAMPLGANKWIRMRNCLLGAHAIVKRCMMTFDDNRTKWQKSQACQPPCCQLAIIGTDRRRATCWHSKWSNWTYLKLNSI